MPEVGSANVPYMIETPGVNFDAASFIDKYSTRMAELEMKKMEKEEKNKLYFQQNYHPSKIVPATIYTPFSTQIKQAITDYGDWYTTKLAQGANPNDPSLMAEITKKQSEINTLNQMGKEVQDAIEANKKLVQSDPSKHSLEDFTAWTKGLEGKDPKQMYEYVSKTPAFKYEFDPIDFLKDAGVTPQSIVSATGGAISTNRDDVKGQIGAIIGSNESNQRKFFQSALALTDKEGKPLFDPATAKYDDVLNYFTDQIMPFAKRDVYRPPSGKTDYSDDSLTSRYSRAVNKGAWGDDWTLSYTEDSGFGKLSIANKLNKDTAEIQADWWNPKANDGKGAWQKVQFNPKKYIINQSNGTIGVEGTAKVKGTDIPILIDYDTNKTAIQSHLEGFDPRVYFEQKQGGSAPAKSSGGTDLSGLFVQ
jgi:hypothetical protein